MQGMMRRGRGGRSRHIWWFFAIAIIVVPSISAVAAAPSVTEINSPGFGDSSNNFAWAMAWFKGSLYVGTARNEECVRRATIQRYKGKGYTTNPAPGTTCPPNPYDMDLRAEIWRFTPTSDTTGDWTQVYQSPVIPNPADPSKDLALDIGYRGMAVYTSPSGDQELYVAAAGAGSFIEQVQNDVAPRILRTSDGTNFTSITGDPYNIYTHDQPVNGIHPIGYRSLEVYDNRLFVTATEGLLGTGVLMEIGQPWSDTATFTQVTPNNMQVFEIAAFNNQLYVGTGDETTGFGVYRTTATGPGSYTYTPVVTDGGGRGNVIQSVVSMNVFNNRLYVGTGGSFKGSLPVSELIRVAPDDSWELVVGRARDTTEGYLEPISTLPPGFGNVFNMHFWRMADYSGGIYLGTADWSWQLPSPITQALLSWEFGFDVYGSCDGQYWGVSTVDAFGDGRYNFGARTMLDTPAGGFIGSGNFAQGTSIYQVGPNSAAPDCSQYSVSDYWSAPFSFLYTKSDGSIIRSYATPSNSSAQFNSASASSQPMLLQADNQPGGTVLSWDPSAGAKLYRVYRAAFTPNSSVGVPSPNVGLVSPGDTVPEIIDVPNNGSVAPNVSIMGQFKTIGFTKLPFFVDSTAINGISYAYEVRAVSSTDDFSGFSNMIVSPSEKSNATFDSINGFISSLLTKGQLSQNSAASLSASVNAAQGQKNQGQIRDSLTTLGTVLDAVKPGSGLISDDVYAEELATQISSLQRSIALAGIVPAPWSRSTSSSLPSTVNSPLLAQKSSRGIISTGGQDGSSPFSNAW